MFPKNISPNFHRFYIISILIISFIVGCSPASKIPVSPTPTFSKFLPPTWTPTITATPKITLTPTEMLTSLPTSTLSSSSILSDFFLSPRIYPVFWRDGAIYIGSLASEKTQELVHLYDQPTQVSSSGDITYLYNDSETAKISPDGRTLVYMNMEDGFLYSYNLITKEKKKISQPDSGSSQRTWQGSWSLDGKYLLYAMDIVELRDDEVFGQEFPSIFITDITQDIFSQVTTWNTAEISP